jgi:hypothetical protein
MTTRSYSDLEKEVVRLLFQQREALTRLEDAELEMQQKRLRVEELNSEMLKVIVEYWASGD